MYNLKIIKCENRIEIYKYSHFTVAERGKEEEFFRFIEPTKEKKESSSSNKKSKEQNRIDNLNNSRNKIIRLIKAGEMGVHYWEIAKWLGIRPETFSRLLREKLNPQQKEKVMRAIYEISYPIGHGH